MNDDLLRDTERFLHEQIPLTQAMGVQIESYDEAQLVVTAPLEPNHNHLGTAFGGSLSALTTLTGYAMLWLQLGDQGREWLFSLDGDQLSLFEAINFAAPDEKPNYRPGARRWLLERD